MHEASFYTGCSEKKAKCTLCPHECIIQDKKKGICKVRSCRDGKLFSDTYGKLSAVAVDPVEKKPLYHFFPGKRILSLGSVGCNMRCDHCQNENISQCIGITADTLSDYSVEDVKRRADSEGTDLVAFTYNEPSVNYEFMLDTAKVMVDSGRACVMVSNGFIMREPLQVLLPWLEAFNIDLKAFDDAFYRKVTGSRIDPVLRSMEIIHQAGKHMEITYLVIPGLNDDREMFTEMVGYLAKTFGHDQVLHLSRYFPHHKMNRPPTPLDTLEELTGIARKELNYVYPGNTGPALDSNTYCPACGSLLIQRSFYQVSTTGLVNGRCVACEKIVNGKFIKS